MSGAPNVATPARRRPHEAWVALAVALAVTTFRQAPWTFFSGDDIVHLSRAAGDAPWNGAYRPLSEGLSFWLQYRLFGLDPLGYHLVNLALHALNVVGVYLLAVRWLGNRGAACAAAVLFGCASIAFTPLHWASGVIELLAGALLLAATLVHLESARRGARWRWGAAGLALAAMLAKETAAAWPAFILWFEFRRRRGRMRVEATLPAVAATVAFVVALATSGHLARLADSSAYGVSAAPPVLFGNFMTYVGWCVALWEPIRDRVAAVQPAVWPAAGAALILFFGSMRGVRAPSRFPAVAGAVWFTVFLAPVLPLVSHTYLYYLYIPWIGGAIAVTAVATGWLERRPARGARLTAVAALALLVGIEIRNVHARETATRNALPVDRTMREALLLGHAIPALREADLRPGTAVGFVNPVPGRHVDLLAGTVSGRGRRVSYWALEAAMHDGTTLRLFVPGLVYRGFATRIPADWEDVECFRFEQRGWLERWGSGPQALMRQAEILMTAGRWSAAESTFIRVRAINDTVPGALSGQMRALVAQGRRAAADSLARAGARRRPAARDPASSRPDAPGGP